MACYRGAYAVSGLASLEHPLNRSSCTVRCWAAVLTNCCADIITQCAPPAVQATHVGRITVRLEQHQQTPLLAGDSSAARTVLITGGLGALGLLVATWMARTSANLRLVLVGRTGRALRGRAPAATLHEIMSGGAGGSMFTLRMGDASSAADMPEACTPHAGQQPPVQARCIPQFSVLQQPGAHAICPLHTVAGFSPGRMSCQAA